MKAFFPLAILSLSGITVAQSLPNSSQATWAYAALGSGLGRTRIAISTAGSVPEIYLGSYSPFWVALRYDAATASYAQSFVSSSYDTSSTPSTQVVRIAVADVIGDANEEIVVGLNTGVVFLYDRATKALLTSWSASSNGLVAINTFDVDGDGKAEILALDGSSLRVLSGAGALLWTVPNVAGSDVIGGQFDADPTPEIITSDGHVIDVATRTVQWTYGGFGIALERADIDHDGMDELIAATPWSGISAFDVDTQSPKWTIPPGAGGTESMCLADLDGNGTQELLVGDAQWGQVHIYDMATQTEIGNINNPEHGVTALAAADVDQDGTTEILWSAGATSSGSDFLYVASSVTHQVEWQSQDLEGPFVGPLWGDLDGDGHPEIVAVSTFSAASYDSGRILVFDGQTHALRAMSAPIMQNAAWTGIHDAQLYDFDHDGRMEIVVAADHLYDGRIEVWSFSAPNTFTLTWANATQPSGSPFTSVAVGDVDGDGNVEIVGGGSRAHTGALGTFVYVYDYATHQEEWHSAQMGNYWDGIGRVLVRDTDQDSSSEIVAMVSGGTGIYVIDGTTKIQEGFLPGAFTSCEVVRSVGASPVRSIATGDASGNVALFRHQVGGYVQVSGGSMSSGSIDGITAPFHRMIFLGSQGSLRVHASLNPTRLWESESYGSQIGQKIVYLPNGSTKILACSSYAVLGF